METSEGNGGLQDVSEERPLEIHTSDVQTFKDCRQEWDFSSPLRMGFRPNRVVEPLDFGDAMHKGLAVFYSPGVSKGPREQAAKAMFETAMLGWKKKLGEDADQEDEEEYEKHLAMGLGMLDHYFEWAPAKDEGLKFVWVEKEYHVHILVQDERGNFVVYSFKPDGLVEDENGKLWLWENKTAARIEDNLDFLQLDDQCGKYLWGIREAEGLKVEGVIYNTLRKKVPPPLKSLKKGGFSLDKAQDVTYPRAKAQLLKEYGFIPPDYREFLTHLQVKGNNYFQRVPVHRNQTELDNLGKMVLIEAKEMLSNPEIYRNPSRYNCSGCSFVGPCIAKYEGSDYQTMLDGNYHVEVPS